MRESVIQLCRVEGVSRLVVLFHSSQKIEDTLGERAPANTRASSRGKTGGASLIQCESAYSACRRLQMLRVKV